MSEHEAHEEYLRDLMRRTMPRAANAAVTAPMMATVICCQSMPVFLRHKDTKIVGCMHAVRYPSHMAVFDMGVWTIQAGICASRYDCCDADWLSLRFFAKFVWMLENFVYLQKISNH